jgi:hypothetical protein
MGTSAPLDAAYPKLPRHVVSSEKIGVQAPRLQALSLLDCEAADYGQGADLSVHQ